MKKVMHSDQIPANAVGQPGAKRAKMRLLIGANDGAPLFAMRQFELEPGGCTPNHEHSWEHELYFLQGSGTVLCGGEDYPVRPGSFAFVPPNEPHQVQNSGMLTLKFLCLIPVTENCGCPIGGAGNEQK